MKKGLIIALAVAAVIAGTAVIAQIPGGGDNIIGMLNNQLAKQTIEFAHDSYKFDDPQLVQRMDSVAPAIKNVTSQMPSGYSLFVIGHTTSDGDAKYNENLANWRARSVFYRLEKAGVDKKVMEWIGVSDKDGSKRAVSFEIRKYGN